MYINVCICIYITSIQTNIYIYIYIYIYKHVIDLLKTFRYLFGSWLQGNLLYSFEAPCPAYKRLKKLTSFNNNTLNKINQKALASWIFRVLSLFNFQKMECDKAPDFAWKILRITTNWKSSWAPEYLGNVFFNLKEAWTYLHQSNQCMLVYLKLA